MFVNPLELPLLGCAILEFDSRMSHQGRGMIGCDTTLHCIIVNDLLCNAVYRNHVYGGWLQKHELTSRVDSCLGHMKQNMPFRIAQRGQERQEMIWTRKGSLEQFGASNEPPTQS